MFTRIIWRLGSAVVDHALHSGRSHVQASPSQDLCDRAFTKARAEQLEALYDASDESREPVLAELDERVGSCLVDSLEPGRDGGWLNEECPGCLRLRPSVSYLEFETGHPTRRAVVRPMMRMDLGQANILDADLFAEPFGVLTKTVVLASELNTGIDAVGGPSPGAGDGVVCQGNHVDDG